MASLVQAGNFTPTKVLPSEKIVQSATVVREQILSDTVWSERIWTLNKPEHSGIEEDK